MSILSSCYTYRYSTSFSQTNVVSPKEAHGESSSPVVMCLFGGHSGSVKEAAENGKIDTIYRVEYEKSVILGGFVKVWTTHVYGSRKNENVMLRKVFSPLKTESNKVSKPQYETMSLPLDIQDDEVRICNSPKEDSLYVLSKHSLRVYVDGKFVGYNNQIFKAIQDGYHKVELRESGYCIIEENVSVFDFGSAVSKSTLKTLTTEASFPSKYGSLQEYIAKNTSYPEEAQKKNLTGRVEVSFIVSEAGAIKKVEVTRSVNESLDSKAVAVIKGMPKWEPATLNGKKVSSFVTVPIVFGEDK